MILLTKLFLITDASGEDIDVKRMNIGVYLNGKKTEFTLRNLFSKTEFDDGEIYGNSLLGFYNVTDDGKLFVEGSLVELRNEDNAEQIKFVKIKRPGITNDKEISFEDVQKFVQDFGIEKPADVFPDLNDEEKNVLIAEQDQREATTRQEKTNAQKAIDEAEAARIEKEKEEQAQQAEVEADKAMRAKINPANVYDGERYNETKEYFKNANGKEYISQPYHIFFANEEDPVLLIKRGKDWYEHPKQEAFESETEDEIIIEFEDMKVTKELTFNSATGEIKIVGNGQ